MKKIILYFAAFAALCMAWFGFNRATLPASPVICGEISQTIDLNFKMNKMDLKNLELSSTSDADIGPIFANFKMAGNWKTGSPGLIVSSIGKSSNRSKALMSKERYVQDNNRKKAGGTDFTHFMKDKRGKSVNSYTFRQTIVEEKSGKHFMKMTYEGPSMKMIQFLKITEPIVLPQKLSSRFNRNGRVVFQPGTYHLDKSIGGYYLPVAYQ